MRTNWLRALAPVLLIGTAGCPDVKVDEGEGVGDSLDPGPIVEFDPAGKIIPFPNNLLLDPMTGRVKLPEGCNESDTSKATRENVLNKLDGFGTYEAAISVTFSGPVDAASLTGRVLLYKRATGGTMVDPASAMPVPVATIVGTGARYNAACTETTPTNSLTIVPLVPLDQKSSYVVALLKGITTGGEPFGPSFTWSLIRQDENPVTIDANGIIVADRTPLDPSDPADATSLRGIDQLWKAHRQAMLFIKGTDASRTTSDVLLAWEFKTQTVNDQLDPTVTNSAAAIASDTQALQQIARVAPINGETFLRMRLPANSCSADGGPLPCQAVAEVLGGALIAPQFQTLTDTNPMTGGKRIPGQFSDPVLATSNANEIVGALITTTTAPCATNQGCPTVIFGHALGQDRTSLLAIASQLAAVGYNSIAFDFVAHGSRAVQISDEGDCAGVINPIDDAACYAPFLSGDLGTSRDNIRQSVLDVHSAISALKKCGSASCGLLKVDPARVMYLGMSLGGIVGAMATAGSNDLKAAVLNVPAGGWLDIIENTMTNELKCGLVDALIDAGVLMGDKSSAGASALCLTATWTMQPGYRQFSAIARWVLDPGDPANFGKMLAPRRFAIQQVVNDTVFPNVATDRLAMLSGLTKMSAACNTVGAQPSPAIAAMAARWVEYPPMGCNNIYGHPSLLRPVAAVAQAQLATQQMQVDVLTYFQLND